MPRSLDGQVAKEPLWGLAGLSSRLGWGTLSVCPIKTKGPHNAALLAYRVNPSHQGNIPLARRSASVIIDAAWPEKRTAA